MCIRDRLLLLLLLLLCSAVGSTDKMTQEMWVYDEASDSIVKRMVTYVPGLYKIFDEIIVNAADNKQRDSTMSKLKVGGGCRCCWHLGCECAGRHG